MISEAADQMKKPLWRPILLTLLMGLGTFVTMGVMDRLFEKSFDFPFFLSTGIWIGFLTLFFIMIRSGKIDRIRSILFFIAAVTFSFSFVLDLFEQRHHLFFASYEDIATGTVPFCHIAITQSLLSAPIFRKMIYFGTLYSPTFHYTIMGMLLMWLGISLFLGRGWCSWYCFFGGWEDGISHLAKKRRVKKMPKAAFYIPYAILLAVALISMLKASPVYCQWLCPFKATSEAIEIASPLNIIQTVIFGLLFLGLVVLLPFLSKKRTQCSFVCPFGAMQSLIDRIHPVGVRILKDKCKRCGKCIAACPMSAIRKENLESGKAGIGCVKCGKCMDVCAHKAVSFHIKGTPLTVRWAGFARGLFQFFAYFLLAMMASGFIYDSIFRLQLLITTGSLIRAGY